MAGSGTPQTFLEGLQMLIADASRLATLPDADPTFCSKIAQACIAKARPAHIAQGGQSQAAGGGPGIGPQGIPGGPPGGSPANGQMPTQGAPTMGAGPTPGLNPMASQGDEIRRMIAGGAGTPG